ncbi:putative tricarboxylic transport membrane protein [Acetomicrobium flavidum]|uniref:Tricarboxylic transport membrane protein n=1 Tax=Acetomicrobium flavidum TaxID=49896 RepID=A0ABY1JEX4_9BACT|nr:putative tricarboxylic transport membrane protein [Acetomicrobium flavidum]
METINNLLYGLSIVVQPVNIIFMSIGCILGTVLGMLPGVGPATGVALLLPLTFTMEPETALITMAAVYYGAMFGGSRSAILLNVPGDGAAVASCFDGYPMAMNGKAESALAISAVASFIGGLVAAVIFLFLAMPVARFALRFGPPEYFMLMVFALSATASLTEESPIKGFMSLLFGLMITTIGIDLQSGVLRFTYGIPELQTGIDFVVVIVGIYGIGEVFKNYENIKETGMYALKTTFGRIWFTLEEWRRCVWPILRESIVGFIVGVLPGAGGTIAAMMAYSNEKRLSKEPERFGTGVPEGLAAPESANNAASIGAMIPMLTLGVPGSGTTAVMLGALMIYGLQPGPLLFQQHPEIAWGVIASLFVGDLICIIINLPLAGLLVRLLSVPGRLLYPLIVVIAFFGVYTINFSIVDFYLLLIFGFVGYFMRRYKVPLAPMVLSVVLGSSMENSFRQSLMLSDGSLTIFLRSGISITLMVLTLLSVIWPIISRNIKMRRVSTKGVS